MGAEMSVVLEVRLPRELKERMDRFSHVNWEEELRKFIEARVRALEVLQALDEVRERAKSRVVRTDSTDIIREERDRR